MTTVIKRNTHLKEVLRHWNHKESSTFEINGLSKTFGGGVYIINKITGRHELAVFNITDVVDINGEIVSYNPLGYQLNFGSYGIIYKGNNPLIKSYIFNWVRANKDELCIQLHYLHWFNNVKIENLTLEETVKILMSYTYNQEEAEIMFDKLNY